MRVNKKYLIFSIIMVLAILMILGTGYVLGIVINTTESLPRGLYKKVERETLQHGDIVNLAVPVNGVTIFQYGKHPFMEHPDYFLKVIYGMEGDEVYIENNTVFINNYMLHTQKDVLSILTPGTIPEGYAFVGTPHEKSFDSRYYGLIETKTITGVYEPLLLFGAQYGTLSMSRL
jgi:conjugative transfer signal peptidase TraF